MKSFDKGFEKLLLLKKKMVSKWGKVKLALGLNLCTYVPKKTLDENDDSGSSTVSESERHSGAALITPATADWDVAPATPRSQVLKLSKSLSRSSKVCFPVLSLFLTVSLLYVIVADKVVNLEGILFY